MICAGIDTGKRKLDVALDGSSEQLQVDNTPEGYTVLSDWLRRHGVKRIGIEASGGYEQAVVAELRVKLVPGSGRNARCRISIFSSTSRSRGYGASP
jgi:transposase